MSQTFSVGFIRKYFVSEVDTYICGFCLNVCRDPRQCQKGHLFCLDCVNHSASDHLFECSVCKTHQSLDTICANAVAKKEISKLKVQCKCKIENSCDSDWCCWVGPLSEQDKNKCKVKLKLCPHKGCGKMVEPSELERHKINCSHNITLFDSIHDDNLPKILKRYHSDLATVTSLNMIPIVSTRQVPYLSSDVTENENENDVEKSGDYLHSVIVNHALNGEKFFEDLRWKTFSVVFQTGLLLTVSASFVVCPPIIQNETNQWYFDHIMSVAMCMQLFMQIGFILVNFRIQLQRTENDKFIEFCQYSSWFEHSASKLTIFNILLTTTALFFATDGSTKFDTTYLVYVVCFMTSIFILPVLLYLYFNPLLTEPPQNDDFNSYFHQIQALRFHQKYCELNGELKGEYLALIHSEEEDGQGWDRDIENNMEQEN